MLAGIPKYRVSVLGVCVDGCTIKSCGERIKKFQWADVATTLSDLKPYLKYIQHMYSMYVHAKKKLGIKIMPNNLIFRKFRYRFGSNLCLAQSNSLQKFIGRRHWNENVYALRIATIVECYKVEENRISKYQQPRLECK